MHLMYSIEESLEVGTEAAEASIAWVSYLPPSSTRDMHGETQQFVCTFLTASTNI
jgi:hypothetical protein